MNYEEMCNMKKELNEQYSYIVSALRYDKDCVIDEVDEMIKLLNHFINLNIVNTNYTKYKLNTLKYFFEVFRDGYKNNFYSMDNLKRIDCLMDIEYKNSICNAIGTTKEQYDELNGYVDDFSLYMV